MRYKRKIKWVIGIAAMIVLVIAVVLVLRHEKTLLTHPKGVIASQELDLIISNYLHMAIIVIPTIILLFLFSWRYREKNKKAKYRPEQRRGPLADIILWAAPSAVIAAMAVVTWHAVHKLDPYRSIESANEPLTIQVVALDWKWLFIYPQQGIATLNFVQFPEKVPVHFELCADGSPMNSFWIPELSGQIYAMTGMTTQLHVMADGLGQYSGRAAEINGRGFAGMIFVAKSTSSSDFDEWVAHVKSSSSQLTHSIYDELIKPSENNPIAHYSFVEEDLFDRIIMKYMHPK